MTKTANKADADKPRRRRGRRPRPRAEGGSREAKRIAAAVLEVLAGARSPAEAASALDVSVPRYYALEAIAVGGLVSACELRPAGAGPSESELATLKKAHSRLEQECARYRALARLTQRTVGLSPPAPVAEAKGRKKRRQPRIRALRAVAAIGSETDERTQTFGHEARRPSGGLDPGQTPAQGDP
jgi:hypothetical protein